MCWRELEPKVRLEILPPVPDIISVDLLTTGHVIKVFLDFKSGIGYLFQSFLYGRSFGRSITVEMLAHVFSMLFVSPVPPVKEIVLEKY